MHSEELAALLSAGTNGQPFDPDDDTQDICGSDLIGAVVNAYHEAREYEKKWPLALTQSDVERIADEVAQVYRDAGKDGYVVAAFIVALWQRRDVAERALSAALDRGAA